MLLTFILSQHRRIHASSPKELTPVTRGQSEVLRPKAETVRSDELQERLQTPKPKKVLFGPEEGKETFTTKPEKQLHNLDPWDDDYYPEPDLLGPEKCYGCSAVFAKYSSMISHLETDSCTPKLGEIQLNVLAARNSR